MSEAMPAVAGVEKQWRLPPAQAERLTAYARARGVSEEEVVCHALDFLWSKVEPVAAPEEDLPELAAPPDWEVEVPIVLQVPPKSVTWVKAQVVRCGRGTFPAITEEVLLDPDEPLEETET
jgi:hypothetical protein